MALHAQIPASTHLFLARFGCVCVQICLYTLRLVAHTRASAQHSTAHEAGYVAWRQAFGVQPPVAADSFTFVQQFQNLTDLFKYRVSLEAYFQAVMTGANLKDTVFAVCALFPPSLVRFGWC
jgi:hypothetical protein